MSKKQLLFPLISLIFFFKPVKVFIHTLLADSVYIPVLKAEKYVEEIFYFHREYSKLNELLLITMENIEEKNRREIFDLWKSGLDSTVIIARALYFDPFGQVQKITLDRGRDNGVRYGQPVVYRGSLVGKVYYTTDRLSFVMTLYNENFRVGITDRRTGVLGVLAGGIHPEVLYIPLWADVKPGDTLLTSGIGIIRGGIPVGVIEKVDSSSDFFYRIFVKPFWDFSATGLFGILR